MGEQELSAKAGFGVSVDSDDGVGLGGPVGERPAGRTVADDVR